MTLCPLDVNVREVIYHGRSLLHKTDHTRKTLRSIARFVLKRPKTSFRMLSTAQHFAFPYLSRAGLIPHNTRLPEHTLKDNIKVFSLSRKKGRVAVFAGCMVNFLYPFLGEALIRVLHQLRYEVILLAGDLCCGAPLRSLGLQEQAVELANRNVELFRRLNVEAVLSLCPTCTLTLKHEYSEMTGQAIDTAMDITTFFARELKSVDVPSLASPMNKALYHDPCHLKYGLGISQEPRNILKTLGVDLIDTGESKCCGFAGVFSFSFRELSQNILQSCTDTYAETAAEMIITSCPGCIFQLTKSIQDKPVVHVIELLEEALLQKA
jgi:glycolate oxidase iron-sulfur subunit